MPGEIVVTEPAVDVTEAAGGTVTVITTTTTVTTSTGPGTATVEQAGGGTLAIEGPG